MKCFSFDTSAFIEPWCRHYPMRLAESLWGKLDSLGKQGIVLAQEAVQWEIDRVDDDLAQWLSARPHFFRETTEEVQVKLREIMRSHGALVAAGKNRSGGDPWVIAQAIVSGASVVSYESWDPKRRRVKIPEVCETIGIPCITFVDFLLECKIELHVRGGKVN